MRSTIFRALTSYAGIMSIALLVSACGGGKGGGQPPPPPQNQTIAFATAGPVTGAVGTTVTNVASGGAGTGTITYATSSASVATVAASGVATLVGTGTATITATKAASAGFNSATATYQLQATPGTQTIAFAVAGPRNVVLASTSDNAASGGAGTGAITYESSNTTAVTVNPTTGAATASGLGSATITAVEGCGRELRRSAGKLRCERAECGLCARLGRRTIVRGVPACDCERQAVRAAPRLLTAQRCRTTW